MVEYRKVCFTIMSDLLKQDECRYPGGRMPLFQKFWRKVQRGDIWSLLFKPVFIILRRSACVDLGISTKIGGGLYFGHPYGIIINPNVIIGRNCNIHKGVLIGCENRGSRRGAPVIGNEVWIGINAAVVGNIRIGNDVLIAPNSYVNFDVPDHSIVFGNPGMIKHCEHATKGYINHKTKDF